MEAYIRVKAFVEKVRCMAKVNVDAMAQQLESSLERAYELAMETFKNEAKQKDLGKYYYRILDIPVILSCIQVPSMEEEEGESLYFCDGEDGPKVARVGIIKF